MGLGWHGKDVQFIAEAYWLFFLYIQQIAMLGHLTPLQYDDEFCGL